MASAGHERSDPEFICEPMTPMPGTANSRDMARGLPGLPARFTWRDEVHEVLEVLAAWKQSGRERGGTEIYLRRHWSQIRTASGMVLTLYCDRQAKNRNSPKRRWWVYTLDEGPSPDLKP